MALGTGKKLFLANGASLAAPALKGARNTIAFFKLVMVEVVMFFRLVMTFRTEPLQPRAIS